MFNTQIKDGEYTTTVYTLIREDKHADVIRILQNELDRSPNSRAALSLLGYCYFQFQDFVMAADCYEQLCKLFPFNQEYRLYLAQSYFNAFQFQEAAAAVLEIDKPDLAPKVLKLEAAIRYREEDYHNARILVEQFDPDDTDIEINLACIDYKEANYHKALERFTSATAIHGYSNELSYAIALCHYELKAYAESIKLISDIIDYGIKNHPELGVGSMTDGIDVRSVGNTIILHESALIEACNLKFAIEYKLLNYSSALHALTDMPPRDEEELDPVTLHNHAIFHVNYDSADAFAKLQYLLSQNPFPPETFANLLLIYVKYSYFDLAADVLAEHAHLSLKYLPPYIFDYLDAVITQQTSPSDSYAKFDALSNELTTKMRKAKKKEDQGIETKNDLMIQEADQEYKELKEMFIPVLMGQANIYWIKKDYANVEKVFQRSVEFASDNDDFKLNVAHTLFMTGVKYKEAIGFYEPILNKHINKILDISAIVLADLCVCYVLSGQNETAEDVMREVERAEEITIANNPNQKIFHSCIINLVIGSLYCAKGNFEFGMTRVVKALDPYDKKLGVETWYYSKRCFISMIENLAKHLIPVRDSILNACLLFLEQCEIHGKNISTLSEDALNPTAEINIKKSVSYEARFLRALLLTYLDY
uniref:Tetratricopeptide repeat protein 30 n=1 Tax=Rhabditophanes sp. KR3021 TaxID=114890 RepID=A0AC35TRF9_9BILA